MIEMHCPNCNKLHEWPDDQKDQQVACPRCEADVVLTPRIKSRTTGKWVASRPGSVGKPIGYMPKARKPAKRNVIRRRHMHGITMSGRMYGVFKWVALFWTIFCLLIWFVIAFMAAAEQSAFTALAIRFAFLKEGSPLFAMISPILWLLAFVGTILVAISIWIVPSVAILVGLAIFKIIKDGESETN